jgi:hypothetical protein
VAFETNSAGVDVFIHLVRLAVTGNPSGPSLYHLLEVVGKEKVLGRIERALAHAGHAGWKFDRAKETTY